MRAARTSEILATACYHACTRLHQLQLLHVAEGGLPESAPLDGVKEVARLQVLQIHSPALQVDQQLPHQALIARSLPLPVVYGRLAPWILLQYMTSDR